MSGPSCALLLLVLAQETPEERQFTLEVIEAPAAAHPAPHIIGEEPHEPTADSESG